MRDYKNNSSWRLIPLALFSTVLAACSGSSSGPIDDGSTLNEASCDLQYEINQVSNNTGTDPLVASQWHLSNTGQTGGTTGEDLNVSDVWLTNRGENARVAVIDDAIEVLHEDLQQNVVPGASYNYRAARRGTEYPLPCSPADDHGTAVAGIIAARDSNTTGGAGIAPRVELVGYNALITGQDADVADALGRDLAVTSVYNNSWGAQDNGVLNPADNAFIQAILDGIELGRGGLGAVYVFSAGNGGIGLPNGKIENSNYDGFVNKLGVIAACAIDQNGDRPDYGERGANMMVCGPSGNFNQERITTTNLQSTYRSNFSGTSASAPMVSGVAALVLAENPNLSWRDVQQILIQTARQNDPGDPEWSINFGLSYNPQYGFGAVDAGAAVAAARNWSSIGNSSNMVSCGPFASQPNLPIPDSSNSIGVPVTDTVSVTGCAISRIEFVEIQMTADHAYDGDLRVNLISPNGLVSELASERICSGTQGVSQCGEYDDWLFGSQRHRDEPAAGNWTLSIEDAQDGDTGSLTNWSVTFYGR
jgi:subtilisin-like proprotein convertase family protein